MDGRARQSADDATEIPLSVGLKRLVYELSLLVDMSAELQSNIHDIDLRLCDPHSRKALQSADTLWQRARCIRQALDGLASPTIPGIAREYRSVVENVFLEDVRFRLLTGYEEDGEARAEIAGKVDLF
jgi:hypothetical protein